MYRGTLVEAEDNMNCQLEKVSVTARDGRVTPLEQCYVRGSHVRFFIIPDALKNAPMFKKVGLAAKSKGPGGRGGKGGRGGAAGAKRGRGAPGGAARGGR